MFKGGGSVKFSRATVQVVQVNFLRLGKRKPVRQLKKAGGIRERIQQILYTHPKQKYDICYLPGDIQINRFK